MPKILIIDDDFSNREILRARLEQGGHHVTEASNGEEGLQLLEELLPDLILLDVMMPKVDGLQVCREIKSNPRTEKTPVVILTALDQKIDKLRGWESGADDYLSKPWEPARLMELVNKWCPAAGSPASQEQKAS